MGKKSSIKINWSIKSVLSVKSRLDTKWIDINTHSMRRNEPIFAQNANIRSMRISFHATHFFFAIERKWCMDLVLRTLRNRNTLAVCETFFCVYEHRIPFFLMPKPRAVNINMKTRYLYLDVYITKFGCLHLKSRYFQTTMLFFSSEAADLSLWEKWKIIITLYWWILAENEIMQAPFFLFNICWRNKDKLFNKTDKFCHACKWKWAIRIIRYIYTNECTHETHRERPKTHKYAHKHWTQQKVTI